jgi:hypothetical protein
MRRSHRPAVKRTFRSRRASLPASEEREKQRQHVIRVWIASEHRLRKDELAVDVHVKDAVSSGDQLDCPDIVLVLLENSRRQTDRVRSCASRDAVLDPDMRLSHFAEDTSPPMDGCWPAFARLEECELSHCGYPGVSTLAQPTVSVTKTLVRKSLFRALCECPIARWA